MARTTRSSLGGAPAKPAYAEVPSDDDLWDEYECHDGRFVRYRKTRDEKGNVLPKFKPKSTKRRRKSTHSAAGHLHLEGLLDAPLECIVHAIFSMLEPRDLIALARTSRSLRNVLLARDTGLVVFKRSFARLFASGLPVPPKSLSLPAYATLLSIETCSFCARKLSTGKWKQIVCASSRKAVCSKCFKTELVSFDTKKIKAEFVAIDPRVAMLVAPFVLTRFNRYRRFYGQGEEDEPKELFYARRDIDDLFDELDGLDEAEADLFAHFTTRAAKVQLRIQAGRSLNTSLATWRRDQAAKESRERRHERWNKPAKVSKTDLVSDQIVKRLKADGYAADVIERLVYAKFGYSSSPTGAINDASYKRIKARCDGVIAQDDKVLADAKEAGRIGDRLEEIRADFADMIEQRAVGVEDGTEAAPAFEAFMRREDWRALVEDTMSADEIGVHWSSLVANLEPTIDAIRADALADLAALIRGGADEGAMAIDGDVTDLALIDRASAIFKCSSLCKKDRMQYPRVLDHDCYRGSALKLPPIERPTQLMQLARPALGPMIETALEAAGLEPKMTTSEFHTLSARFFVSPLWRARNGPGVHSLILSETHRLIDLLITIIDKGVDQNVAAFIRCTTHADDMDSVELATCAVCDDQRIDTPREIRLHLGTKHGLVAKQVAQNIEIFTARDNALVLTEHQEALNALPDDDKATIISPPRRKFRGPAKRWVSSSDESESD